MSTNGPKMTISAEEKMQFSKLIALRGEERKEAFKQLTPAQRFKFKEYAEMQVAIHSITQLKQKEAEVIKNMNELKAQESNIKEEQQKLLSEASVVLAPKLRALQSSNKNQVQTAAPKPFKPGNK